MFFETTAKFCNVYFHIGPIVNKKRFPWYKVFLEVLNNRLVENSVNNLNKRGNITSISFSDFSILYSTIRLDKFIKVLFEITDFNFKAGEKQFITNVKCAARWVNNDFKQMVSIASNPAPFFARLFCLYYENKLIKEIKKTGIRRGRIFF